MQKVYGDLMKEAQHHETQAEFYRAEAEQVHKQTRKKSLDKWVGYRFESSSGLTPEFAEFSAQVRRELKKISGFELVNYSRGHFYFSAFLKNRSTGKLVFLSCSDVRFFPDKWWNEMLIRAAQHDKDYSGGGNNYCTFEMIGVKAAELTT